MHSLLAHGAGAAWLGRLLGPAARLGYNLIAVFHLGAVLLFGHWLAAGSLAFERADWLVWLQWAAVAAGLLIGGLALRDYDLGRFGGLWYLRNRSVPGAAEVPEPLVVTGLHRYVRHPLYSAAFLLLWGFVDGPLALATAVWASAYFVIGTWFEERKLVRLYGETYRAYRRRVPAFLPWKGRMETEGCVS